MSDLVERLEALATSVECDTYTHDEVATIREAAAELRRVREAPVVVAGTPVGAVDTLMDLGYYPGTPVRLVPERGEVGK